MKNPINKRILRMFIHSPGKYLPTFILFIFTIVVASSYFITQGSLEKMYYDNLVENKVEDGQFTVAIKLDEKEVKKLEEEIDLYENFYVNGKVEGEKVLRVFKDRDKINIPSYFEGKKPEKNDEIAVSKTYAISNYLKIGDEIKIEGKKYFISGFISTPDYTSLLKNRADLVMDPSAFGIALVSNSSFDKNFNENVVLSYSYHNKTELSQEESNKKLDEICKIVKNNIVLDRIIRFDNRTITYLIDDMGGDTPMMMVVMVIIIIALAFIFIIQANSLIEEEAPVIGTLLASGFGKWELIRHYLFIPLSVSVVASLIGNILSYAKLYELYTGIYYKTYSMPPFIPYFSIRAFVLTTLIPLGIIIGANLISLLIRLKIRPLRFLRGELSRNKNRRNIDLGNRKFITKFKIRVLLDNKLNVFTLLFGLFISNILLIFGLSFEPIFAHYADNLRNEMLYNYAKIVKIPKPLNTNDYKKAIIASFDVGEGNKKRISFYGLEKGTKYNDFGNIDDLQENQMIISKGFSAKNNIRIGDVVNVKVPYSSNTHKLEVRGIINEISSPFAYMPIRYIRDILELEDGYFNVYLSDQDIEIDKDILLSVIDKQTVDKNIKNFLGIFNGVSKMILILTSCFYLIIIYVLSKIIVEKSKTQISYLKIFGFESREISKIYLDSVRACVIVFLLIITPILDFSLKKFLTISMRKLDAYIEPFIPLHIYPFTIAMGIVLYILVQLIQTRKISKMNMVEGLKNISG